jgi:RHS repeat-associated protein
LAITNENAVVVEKRLFDAWGSLIKFQNALTSEVPTQMGLMLLDRGYTGHEHLVGCGLINMNGRLYDPKLHRFHSPDNFIQDPSNTQNFNRYGYVLNNPLKYTDPSGELFLEAVLIGAFISALTYTMVGLSTPAGFSLGGLLRSAFMGAFSGAVTFGIGSATSTIGNFFLKASVQALSHGTFQGGMTAVQGGNFWTGFAAGSLASLASSLYQGGQSTTVNKAGVRVGIPGTGFNSIGDNLGGAGMITFGTISGGAGAALTGGNFWQGAVTGLVVSGLNHAMHPDSFDSDGDPPSKYKKYFSRKLDELKYGYDKVIKPILRSTFDKMELYGGSVEAFGFVLAPFTDGASLAFAGYGAQISAFGTAGNISLDLFDRNYDSAGLRLGKFVLTAGMGKAIDRIPYNNTSNLINGYTKYLENHVVPTIEDSLNKFNPPKTIKH